MPIDIENETTLTLTEACKVIPLRRGRHPSIPALWRWCRRGIKGVRLECIRVGRNLVTSRQAISRFFEALASADRPLDVAPPPPRYPGAAPAARRASLAEADRILDEAGICLRKDETPEQYGQRLLADIGDRPDYYFARREVPRLEDELAEFRLELWQQAQQLRDAQRADRWFRNVGKMTCDHCPFSTLCLNSIQVHVDAPPSGYEVLADVHPELSQGDDQ